MKPHNYDVVIAGAGPAGSSAAAYLGNAGVNTLLIDKEDFPREKVCGDGVTVETLPSIERMGIESAFRETVAFCPKGVRVYLSDGHTLTVLGELPTKEILVFIISRYDLDNLLFENACKHTCVDVLNRSMVTSVIRDESGLQAVQVVGRHKKQETKRGRVIIDASGAHSRLAEQFGIRRSVYHSAALRGYFDNIENLGSLIEIIMDDRILPGYFWIFPISNSSANVGCGTLRGRGRLHETFNEFIARHPVARKLRSAQIRGPLKGGVIPSKTDTSSCVRDGIIFCGDAAGFCEPISGEGIRFAIESGLLAAETALGALQSGRFECGTLKQYDTLWQEKFGIAFAKNRGLFDPSTYDLARHRESQASTAKKYEDALKTLLYS